MTERTMRTFEEFWPFYVREHSKPLTRWLHYAGTNNLIGWLLLAVMRRSFKLFIVAVVSAYAFAWFGHFVVERNIPATFKYPLKASLGDLLMYLKIWQGTMDAEVAKYCPNDAIG